MCYHCYRKKSSGLFKAESRSFSLIWRLFATKCPLQAGCQDSCPAKIGSKRAKKSSDVEVRMEKSGKPLRHAGSMGVKVRAGKDFLRGIGGYTVSFQLYTPHDSCCCTLPIRDENGHEQRLQKVSC